MSRVIMVKMKMKEDGKGRRKGGGLMDG